MTNTFKKYCPNVWAMQTENTYQKGDLAIIETRGGNEVEVEVFNLLSDKDGIKLYSIVRLGESYAEKKANRWQGAANNNQAKSNQAREAANEGKDFLMLAEPIKVGHHSEKRHMALIERNHKRMVKSFEYSDKAAQQQNKADYWANKANQVTLADPASIEFFTYQLEQAEKLHKFYLENKDKRPHSYSLTYAKNDVKKQAQNLELAKKLWG